MKISIAQQIEEVQREIKLREHVYPGLISKGSMRQSVADYHLDRMRAALRTLEWVWEHEAAIKAAVKGGIDGGDV